jgi:ubiquinone/menaquinone biosynthesis C-methylase UbiE
MASMWWIRKAGGEPLTVSMAGVTLGERILVLGVGDGPFIAGVGIKSGLSGRTCVYGESREAVERAARAAERAGALVEGSDGAWSAMPFDDASFDVVLVRDVLPPLTVDGRVGALAEVRRVLRTGGRVMVIDSTSGGGPLGRFRRNGAAAQFYGSEGGATRALELAGFKAIRTLAERDGLVFTEGARAA